MIAAEEVVDDPRYITQFPLDISVARRLLEGYSGIAADEVIPRITEVYAKAVKHADCYPCISNYRFLQFHISQHKLYTTVLARLTAPFSKQTLLDVGCCFGQDVRCFAADGAPTANRFGTDLHNAFLELGYELFGDRDRLGGHFMAGDMLNINGGMEKWLGKIDNISATAFLHLFSRADQIKACITMIGFLRPLVADQEHKQLIFGRQAGTVTPGIRTRGEGKWGQDQLFLHNVESFAEMWKEVGLLSHTKWEVQGELQRLGAEGVKGIEGGESARLLVFEVWRCGDRQDVARALETGTVEDMR